jgi:hypothetical protein
MMQDTSYRQMIEPPATPLDLRDQAMGGKIHQVDPAAVARMKAILAENEKKKAKTAVVTKQRLIGFGFNNRLPKPEAVKEQEEMKSELSNEEIIAIHRRYVLQNLAANVLADELSFSVTALIHQFDRLRLPRRARNRRWSSAADVDQVCQVHGLKIRDIPANAMPLSSTAAEPEAKPVKSITTVAPIAEPEKTAVIPTPVSNGRSLELTSLHEQLAAVQSLMEMAQAKSVQVSGTIRLNLVVEIEL